MGRNMLNAGFVLRYIFGHGAQERTSNHEVLMSTFKNDRTTNKSTTNHIREPLIRKGEEEFKLNYKGKQLSEDEWIAAMIAHPKLIERPLVIKGNRAVIGRPPAAVRDLF